MARSAGYVEYILSFFFFQAEDGIRDLIVTGVQTCALPISLRPQRLRLHARSDHRQGARRRAVRAGQLGLEDRSLDGRPGSQRAVRDHLEEEHRGDLPGRHRLQGSTALRVLAADSPLLRPDQQHLPGLRGRSEEHTSELQSRSDLVCRLLLEKKKTNKHTLRAEMKSA